MPTKEEKQLKLEWVDISIKDWFLNKRDEILFVVYGNEIEASHGYFKGYNKLTKEQRDEFYECPECFYYNSIRCKKITDEDEECECYMGREFSSVIVEPLCDEYDEIVSKIIIPILHDFGIKTED